MKRFIFALRVLAIAMAVLAAVAGCFPAIIETLVPFDPDNFEFVAETTENMYFPLLAGLMILAAVRIVLLLIRKLPTDVVACVMGTLCALWMAAMPAVLSAEQPMGGLAGYHYQFTFFGTIAVICGTLSFLANVLLCIFIGCRKRV